jgi:5-methylthioadenosine/S-adenosylhomocysteine deaminase
MTATVFTASRIFVEGAFRSDQYLDVHDGRITAVLKTPPPDADLVDFGSDAVFPGAVNTHTHSHLTSLRGSVDQLALADWLTTVYAAVPRISVDDAYWSAALTYGEALLSGTTTTADFFYLNGHGNERIESAIRAATDLGIRLVMGRAFIDAEWGGEATRETVDVAVARYRELREAFTGNALVEICPAPHSPYGASRAMIEAAHALATEYGSRWYMHVAESESAANGLGGVRALRLLEDWGCLTNRLVAVHAVWLFDGELDRLGATGGLVSYNPASNLFFGERVIDLDAYQRRGITVGLGTDSSASNNSQDMFADLRVAALSQRLRARDPEAVSVSEMLALCTSQGATVMDLPVGELAPGRFADFVVLDAEDPSLQPIDRLESHLVYAMKPRAIKGVYVGGERVAWEGRLVNTNLADAIDGINRLARTQ